MLEKSSFCWIESLTVSQICTSRRDYLQVVSWNHFVFCGQWYILMKCGISKVRQNQIRWTLGYYYLVFGRCQASYLGSVTLAGKLSSISVAVLCVYKLPQ